MKKNENPIKAFCTVDPDQITKAGGASHCNKCNKNLLNLSRSAGKRTGFSMASSVVCGIVAAVTLSSCSSPQEDIPYVGIYYSPDDIDSKSGSYPAAQEVEGEEGIVKSPYGGHRVDVSRIPPDSLVIDPQYPAEEMKLFRI